MVHSFIRKLWFTKEHPSTFLSGIRRICVFRVILCTPLLFTLQRTTSPLQHDIFTLLTFIVHAIDSTSKIQRQVTPSLLHTIDFLFQLEYIDFLFRFSIFNLVTPSLLLQFRYIDFLSDSTWVHRFSVSIFDLVTPTSI